MGNRTRDFASTLPVISLAIPSTRAAGWFGLSRHMNGDTAVYRRFGFATQTAISRKNRGRTTGNPASSRHHGGVRPRTIAQQLQLLVTRSLRSLLDRLSQNRQLTNLIREGGNSWQ